METRAIQNQPVPGPREISPHPSPRQASSLNYRGHIIGLDMLRGAAVLAVIFCHAYSTTTDWTTWHGLAAAWIAFSIAGHLGVHLFFVLSGLLITGILLDGKQSTARDRSKRFFLRRARRILPPYLLLLLVLGLGHRVDAQFVLAALFFVVNLGRAVGAQLSQYSIVWSLAVEEQFYLLWPWIVWRCSLKTSERWILACLLVSPLLRLVLAIHGFDTYFKTYSNLDYLMYGALIACTLRSGQLHRGNIRRITRWLYVAGLAGVAAMGALLGLVHALWVQVVFLSVGRLPFIALCVALLLTSVLAHQKPTGVTGSGPVLPAARLTIRLILKGSGQALAFLGYISYGLYLVHPLIFQLYDGHVARTYLGGFQKSFSLLTLRALLCCGASILIAWGLRSTLEAWFLRRSPPHLPE